MDKLRALSIRQPFADLIMTGDKKIAYRSRPVRLRGRVYGQGENARAGAQESCPGQGRAGGPA